MSWQHVCLLLVLVLGLAALFVPFNMGVALLLGAIGVYLFILWN